jgi:hypothetical protein
VQCTPVHLLVHPHLRWLFGQQNKAMPVTARKEYCQVNAKEGFIVTRARCSFCQTSITQAVHELVKTVTGSTQQSQLPHD